MLRGNSHNYIEFSLDYAQAGFYSEALQLLSVYINSSSDTYPMAAYFMGWYEIQNKNNEAGSDWFKRAQKLNTDYCFPNRLEEVIALEAARNFNPKDSVAAYLLGNFWYAFRQYNNAQECWETSIKYDGVNPICYRNLALLYYNKNNKKGLAREYLEKAFEIDNKDARVLMELDQLYKKMNVSLDERLKLLEDNIKLTDSRDDLYLEYIALLNNKREFKKALSLLDKRQFHPWEGGEGKVPFQHITLHVELAKNFIAEGEYKSAIEHLSAAQEYPHNLGEGKLFGAQENDIFYWLGCAYDGLNNEKMAKQNWEKAAEGLSDPSPAIFYNDQQPDKIFYQGLALQKLGRQKEAEKRFYNLLEYGKKHLNDEVKLDYFAISLPDLLIWEEDLNVRNNIHCNYLIALGEFGLKNRKASISAFEEVLKMDLYHLPAKIHLTMIQEKENNIIEVTK
jgi:tetratricopeptide (TPR) repeat protein